MSERPKTSNNFYKNMHSNKLGEDHASSSKGLGKSKGESQDNDKNAQK